MSSEMSSLCLAVDGVVKEHLAPSWATVHYIACRLGLEKRSKVQVKRCLTQNERAQNYVRERLLILRRERNTAAATSDALTTTFAQSQRRATAYVELDGRTTSELQAIGSKDEETETSRGVGLTEKRIRRYVCRRGKAKCGAGFHVIAEGRTLGSSTKDWSTYNTATAADNRPRNRVEA